MISLYLNVFIYNIYARSLVTHFLIELVELVRPNAFSFKTEYPFDF